MDAKDVASIWLEDELYRFEYSKDWLENSFAISPSLPLSKSINPTNVKRFLENLIPEGKGLEDIVAFSHLSKNNIFGIIQAIGNDTSGALMFGENVDINKAIFREISDAELSKRIELIQEKSIIIWDEKERLSLAGVQEKLPIIIKDDKIGLGDGTLSSTHIMKFQTRKNTHIVINEFYCMTLAKHIGLDVAKVELKRFDNQPTLVVKRFDRIYKKDAVKRLHMIDGCQMLNLPSTYKYERNFGSGRDVKHIKDGANFKKLFKSLELCEVPAKAKLELLNWAMFNLIVGNSDSHAKNFSFFVDKNGIRPTPFYDILCILMYDDVEKDLAMSYGDEFNSEAIKAYQLREFAQEIDINYKLVQQTLKKQCNKVQKVLKTDIINKNLLEKDEIIFVDRLYGLILKRVKIFLEVAKEMEFVTF